MATRTCAAANIDGMDVPTAEIERAMRLTTLTAPA